MVASWVLRHVGAAREPPLQPLVKLAPELLLHYLERLLRGPQRLVDVPLGVGGHEEPVVVGVEEYAPPGGLAAEQAAPLGAGVLLEGEERDGRRAALGDLDVERARLLVHAVAEALAPD